MRFTFERERGSNGALLPLIEEIPSGPIQILEGRNGIGKSLAVRLLELATGTNPYRTDPAAWKALGESLGDTVITAQGDDHDLEVRLSPSAWRPRPDDEVEPGTTTFVDGVPVERSVVVQRLQVIRIAGEETLSQALGGNFAQLSQETARLAESIEPRAQALLDLLDETLETLRHADTSPLDEQAALLEVATAELEEANERRAALEAKLDTVRSGREAMRAVDALKADGPELRSRISAMTRQLDEADAEREEAVQTLSRVAADQDREQDNEKEFERIERLIRRRENAVSRADDRVLELALRLGVEDDAEHVDREAEECALQLSESSRRRAELGRHDRVRQLIADLLEKVADSSDLLDDHALLFHIGGVAVNLMALRSTLSQREAELSATNVAQEIDALDQRIVHLIERREALARLGDELAERDRLRDKVGEALEEFAAVEATLATSATAEFRAARDRLDTAVATTQRVTVERIQAQHALSELTGGSTPEELTERIDRARALDPSGEDPHLDSVYNDLADEVDTAVRTAINAEEVRRGYLAAVETREAQRQGAVAQLQSASSHSWLKPSFDLSAAESWDGSVFAEAIRRLASMRDRIDQAVKNVKAVSTGLLDVGNHLAGTYTLHPAEDGLRKAVVGACERRLVEQFSENEVREALFAGEIVESADLQEMLVTWHHRGRQMIRPLSAFSSGEQAFAYARARIGGLDVPESGQHRLLVLDEFSAFVAGDRRALLYRLLEEVIERGSASQVLLIVPLAQDFSDPGVREAASRDAALNRRMAEVDRRGYFVEAVGAP